MSDKFAILYFVFTKNPYHRCLRYFCKSLYTNQTILPQEKTAVSSCHFYDSYLMLLRVTLTKMHSATLAFRLIFFGGDHKMVSSSSTNKVFVRLLEDWSTHALKVFCRKLTSVDGFLVSISILCYKITIKRNLKFPPVYISSVFHTCSY